MPPKFLTPLRLTLVPGRDDRWVLTDKLCYYSALLKRIVSVPAGFETDLASVPRLPLAYLLAGNTAHQAAVVHDWLIHQIPWKQAADVFAEAMEASGVPAWRRGLMWAAVRVHGLFK